MKKLFMFLAVAGLATFGASCSSDDGGGDGGNGKPTLVAGASSLSVKVNESVTFTAIADGKAVDGVSFYEGNTKLSTTHKFTTIGDKKIVAKKDGFKDSAAITIKVTEDGTPVDPKQLTLTVMPAEVTLGQAVSFIVYEGTTDVTSTAKIFVNETLSGSSYTATAVGTYTVKATKEGAIDSVEKTFKVIEAPVVPESNFFASGSDIESIEEVRLYVHTVGQDVKLYDDIVAGKSMAIFELVSFGDAEGIFSMMIAVEQLAGVEGIITPKYAVENDLELGPLGAYAIFGNDTEVDATNDAGYLYNFITNPNGAANPGSVIFTLEDSVLEADYEGNFSGVFGLNAARGKGVKFTKEMYLNSTLKIAK